MALKQKTMVFSYFYNGLLMYLAEQGKLDNDYIAKHCQGFDQTLETAQSQFTDIAAVATACDIELSLLLESYQIFAETDKVASCGKVLTTLRPDACAASKSANSL